MILRIGYSARGFSMKKNILFSIAFSVLLSAAFVSCGPLMQKPVPDNSTNIDSSTLFELMGEKIPYYNTLYFLDGQGYEFKSASSNKLIITLDGGPGWDHNRIGAINDIIGGYHFVDWLLPLYGEYNIFVPEKFDWGRHVSSFWDIKNREKYTIDNLITNYTSVIKEYLSQNNYEAIIIAGVSEGGIIAPELYLLLEDFNISGLIVISAGGLVSPVDIAAARLKKPLDDESIRQYTDAFNQYLATYSGERYADSPDEVQFRQTGQVFIPLMWYYSKHTKRPFELYKKIYIPVLFIHGQLDTTVSVIATRYVEENLPEKPFDFIYYPEMGHGPTTIGELKRLRADIADWLREKGL
jgi:pimeloyl-ACP methyl ester carboxylesterase